MTMDPQSDDVFDLDGPGTPARDAAEAAIEDLRRRGGVFVDAVRATRMAMVLTDPTLPSNPIVFANQAFLDLTGYHMEEVLGQQPYFLNGPGTDPDDAERFRQILANDCDGVVETVQYAKDGRRFVATVLLSAFKDAAGTTLHHFLSWADVTRRVTAEDEVADLRTTHAALRDSEARYRSLFDNMHEGFALCSIVRDEAGQAVDLIYLDVNEGIERQAGIAREEFVGRRFSELPITGDFETCMAIHKQVADTNQPVTVEGCAQSTGRWREFSVYPCGRDELSIFVRDIDERKRAEAALRESEERFRAIVTANADVVYRMSPDWTEMRALQGQSFLADTEEPSRSWMDRYIDPADHPAVSAAIAKAVQAKTMFELEHRVRRVDGSIGWTLSRAVPLLDAQREVTEWIGTAKNVTARRLGEDALRESKAHLALELRHTTLLRDLAMRRATADSDPTIYDDILAAAITITDADAATLQVYDAQADALVLIVAQNVPSSLVEHVRRVDAAGDIAFRAGQRTFVVFDKDESDRSGAVHVAAGFRSAQATPLLARDGSPIGIMNTLWHTSEHRPSEDQLRFLDLLARQTADLIEQRRADDSLRASEERYRELFERIDEGFCIVEVIFEGEQAVDYRFLVINPAFERHTGIADAEGRLMREIAPDHEQHWFDDYGRVALTGEAKRFEAHAEALDDRWFDLHAFRVGDPARHRVAIVFSDVTQRRRDAEALRQSEERLRQFGEASQDVLWIRDARTLQWTYLTPAFETIYGLSREEALAGDNYRHWLDLIVPEDRQHASDSLSRVRDGEHVTFEFRVKRATDGAIRWLRNTDFPITDERGEVTRIGGIGHDITDHREGEERQKVLLAELQHRVRNILAVIRSMISRSNDGERTTEEYVQHLQGRITALARTQVLLTRRAGAGVDLEDMIRDELIGQAAKEEQFALVGPDVELSPKAAEVLTLAIHELATNATKYGAFARDVGRLRVEWQVETREAQNWLVLCWRESGVAIVDASPRRQGFGSELISRRIPYELRGKGTFALKPGGLESRIEFPLRPGDSILQTGGVD